MNNPVNIYPEAWLNKTIPEAVKGAAGWRCVRCGHPHDTQGVIRCDEDCDMDRHSRQPRRMLTVHHLDGWKPNVFWWNLLPCCQGCHLSLQARVKPEAPWPQTYDLFEQPEHSAWFRIYVAGRAAYCCGATHTRDQVARDIQPLLAWAEGRSLTLPDRIADPFFSFNYPV